MNHMHLYTQTYTYTEDYSAAPLGKWTKTTDPGKNEGTHVYTQITPCGIT